jgi:NAD(P)-dependent dehydrogenase (short-subunit alcohol dehydrogenase family)
MPAAGDLHERGEAPLQDVDGKVAFVTGGDSGIGLGIARAFLNAGMKVVITYRTRAHLDQAMTVLHDASDRLHAINLDVTDRAGFVAAAAQTVRLFGKVHVLVNNAGVSLSTPLTNASFDDFDWCIGVNVGGVFNGIRAFLPHIKAHGEGGQIVATSSMVGGVIVGPFWGVYSTSKFAVSGMMEALRSELAGSNIGVSLFCPAGVDTNIRFSNRNRPAALADVGEPDADQMIAITNYRQAFQRISEANAGFAAMLDPLEAGERVLRGVRDNDLYIFSHGEYEDAIRDRNDALLASFPKHEARPPEARMAFARILRNPIYLSEVNRKAGRRTPPE